MIKSVGIKNFKCFKDAKVKLNDATLLLGANSGGKSSLIQAILLSQTAMNDFAKKQSNTISLDLISNKFNLNFHSFDEIINKNSEDDFFVIEYKDRHNEYEMKYQPTDDSNVVNVENLKGVTMVSPQEKLIYLDAERMVSSYQKIGNINDIKLGKDNIYLGYIVEKGQKKLIEVDIERNHWESEDVKFLDMQINNWLNFILPKSRVSAKSSGSDNFVSLLFGEKSNLHKSNVGYGISYILPIIVAGLIAKKESILIIENPELHLHPKAQSNIASFLAVVAAAGVQLIIETHSEHIINGFRKAILDSRNPLEFSQLTINYFNTNEGCDVEVVDLNENAEINHWPEGFMDQEENDLFEIRKMRLKR